MRACGATTRGTQAPNGSYCRHAPLGAPAPNRQPASNDVGSDRVTHEQLRELLPLLALDLLSPDERADLATHLDRGCDECESELRAHRATAADLAYAALSVTPSPGLRERVLRACTESPPSPARVWRQWTAPAPAHDGLAIVR